MHRGRFPGDNFSVSRIGQENKRNLQKTKQLGGLGPARQGAFSRPYPIDFTGARIQGKIKKNGGQFKEVA